MTDPATTLVKFTPHAGGLDRDALLFHAGRASARPARRWKVLAAALAVGHAGWLAAWTLVPVETPAPVVVEVSVPVIPPAPAVESPTPAADVVAVTEPESADPMDLAAALWPRPAATPPVPIADARPDEPTRPLTAGTDARRLPFE